MFDLFFYLEMIVDNDTVLFVYSVDCFFFISFQRTEAVLLLTSIVFRIIKDRNVE